MLRRILIIAAVALLLPAAGMLQAEELKIEDIGIGIFKDADDFQVFERKTEFSLNELLSKGYLSGRGDKTFGYWILTGKMPLNKDDLDLFSYKWKLTDPSGRVYEGGPHGLQTGRTPTTRISRNGLNPDKEGVWKLELYLWNRDTKAVTPLKTLTYTIKK